MKFDFLGGALEIGGSAVLVQIDQKNILFDSGIRQGANKDPLPNFQRVQELGGLDAIIISHAHLDHIGSLPLISKEYPGARIYMNHMTKDLVRVQLYDSLKVMKNRETEIPLYAEQDVVDTLNRIFPIGYEVRFPIFDDCYLTLYNAGHIAGASFCYLQGKEGNVFYSGDFSVFSQRTIEGAKLPKLRPDVAIVEATYGDRLHTNREIEEKALINLINEAIDQNGKVLIPAFALGRAQEVLLILKGAMNKGSLKKVKVYVDGMVRDVNRAYLQNPLYLKQSLAKKILKGIEPFYDENIIEVKPAMKREELIDEKESVVFVASSGMLTGGPSTYYAEKIAAMENGYIAITGYQDEEAPGKHLLDLLDAEEGERYLKLNGVSFPVKCKIKKIGLSAHSDKNEICGVIERLSARNVIFVHGNEDVIRNLAKEIAANYRGRIFAPDCGEQINISIKNPRKQIIKELPYVMQRKEELSEQNIMHFHHYVWEHYQQQLFTLNELFYLWSGTKSTDEDKLNPFQQVLLNTVYFENDRKRLFLWKAREEKDIALDLEKKEPTQQQLGSKVEEMFRGYPYKKISYSNENRSITLGFDFPDALDQSIETTFRQFTEGTGWSITINENMNFNAAEIMIRGYFGYENVDRISYFIANKRYQVVLKKAPETLQSKKLCDDFLKNTGWELVITSQDQTADVTGEPTNDYFITENSQSVEQNEALYLIDLTFEEEEHKPYRKSIKQRENEKYLELTFITPMIGRRYAKLIEALTKQLGWNIAISDKVNQNELLNKASFLCQKHQVVLKKNPSFLPGKMSVKIQIVDGEEHLSKVREEFRKETGCELEA